MESLKTVDGRFAYGRRMQVAFVVTVENLSVAGVRLGRGGTQTEV